VEIKQSFLRYDAHNAIGSGTTKRYAAGLSTAFGDSASYGFGTERDDAETGASLNRHRTKLSLAPPETLLLVRGYG